MKNLLIITALLFAYNATAQDYKVNDRVEANYKGNGTMYWATIVEVTDTAYLLRFEHGKTKWMSSDDFNHPDYSNISWPANTCDDKETYFKAEDKVEVYDAGDWYHSTVIQAKDGLYYIHYTKYAVSYDCVVNNNRVRAIGSNKSFGNSGGSSGSTESESSIITLNNTCGDDVTFVVGDEEYEMGKFDHTLDIRIYETVSVYCYDSSGKKRLKGTASVGGLIVDFFSVCD